MAPPRFQCLNAGKQVSKQVPSLRAAFSTSQKVQADEPPPPRPSAISSLFSAAEGTSTKFRYQGSTPAFSNPIQQKPPPTSTHTGLQRLMDESNRRRLKAQQSQTSSSKELSRYNNSAMLTQQISRRFKAGDVYAPHDLSEVEMAKWKKREKPNHDVFDLLDFKPAEHYKNFSIMSEYMTPMGKIKHSKETGLRPVNQRRIARAIRRSIGMGLMPSVHHHPEVLYSQTSMTRSQIRTPVRSDVAPVY